MKDPRLIHLSIACTLAGATALSIMIIPFYWHPAPALAPSANLQRALEWPEEPLRAPSTSPPNTLAVSEIPTLTSPRAVKTERYTLAPPQPPIAPMPKASPMPEPKVPPERTDVCAREGGYKVITHHGRGWRCRYPRRHNRR